MFLRTSRWLLVGAGAIFGGLAIAALLRTWQRAATTTASHQLQLNSQTGDQFLFQALTAPPPAAELTAWRDRLATLAAPRRWASRADERTAWQAWVDLASSVAQAVASEEDAAIRAAGRRWQAASLAASTSLQAVAQRQQRWLSVLLVVLAGSLLTWAGCLDWGWRQWRRLSQRRSQALCELLNVSHDLAEQQAQSLDAQTGIVQQANATIARLNDLCSVFSEQAKTAAVKVQGTNQTVEAGVQAVDAAQMGAQTLQAEVQAIGQQIQTLAARVAEIGQIARLADDFANQTNLLALNAAIEAARAGQQGQGFQVIAREIRQLANQSQQSAQQINAIASEIGIAATAAVTAIAAGTAASRDNGETVGAAATAFAEIQTSTATIADTAQRIAFSAYEQLWPLQQLTEMTARVEQNTAAMQAALATSRAEETRWQEQMQALNRWLR